MLKKIIHLVLVLAVMLGTFMLSTNQMVVSAAGTTYYVSSSLGNDSNNGTSSSTPWKTLAKVGQKTYVAGDQILLKCDDSWNECLTINSQGVQTSYGTPTNPITISSYGTGNNPKINRNSNRLEACILIYEASGWKFTNLDIGKSDYGIDLNYHTTGNQYIWIENCYFHDIDGTDYYGRILPQQNEYSYSCGIAISGGKYTTPNITNFTIQNCKSNNVKTIFDPQMYNWATQKTYDVKNLTMRNIVCTGGSWGWTLHDVDTALVENVKALSNGTSYFSVGAAAAVIQNSKDILVQNCDFGFTDYVGTDGIAFDFEGGCQNVRVINSNFYDCEENGILWFNDGGGSWNCGVYNCNMIRCGYGEYASNDGMKRISTTDRGCVVEYIATDKATTWGFSGDYRQECNYAIGTTPPPLPTTGYPMVFNDNSNYIVYSGTSSGGLVGDMPDGNNWGSVTRSWGDYNNDVRYTQTNGAWAQYTFVGSGIDFTAPKTVDSGNVDIYIDGAYVTTVNCYASTYTPLQVIYSNTNLGTGLHNIKVVKSSGSYMNVDTFKVYRNSSAAPTPVADPTDLSLLKGYWEFNLNGNTQGWKVKNNISNTFPNIAGVSGYYFVGTITGSDPFMQSGVLNIPAANKNIIKVLMKNSTSSTKGQIYFTTTSDTSWNDAKHKDFTITANDSGHTMYTIDMSTVSGWTGTINQLRLDPEDGASSGSFSVDYIRVEGSTTSEFASGTDGWTNGIYSNGISGLGASDGYLSGTITGSDPNIQSSDNLGISATNKNKIIIRMKNSTSSTVGQIYFTTTSDTSWNDAKHKDFTITANDSGYTAYSIDMSTVSGWTGTIKQVRVDPEQGASSGSFSIGYISIE